MACRFKNQCYLVSSLGQSAVELLGMLTSCPLAFIDSRKIPVTSKSYYKYLVRDAYLTIIFPFSYYL